MKKFKFILSLVLLISVKLFSQKHQLIKLWETDSIFKVPESVLFDRSSNTLYVSNIDGKDPWGKDGKGSIGKMGADGKNITVDWVTGLNAPKGMGIYQRKLYVADLSQVVVINMDSGKIEKKIDVREADRLNDLTIDKDGTIFVSDTRGAKIYWIKDGKADLLLDRSSLGAPNGVLKYKRNLFVLDGGGMYKLSRDHVFSKMADGLDGGADGIERIRKNTFIVSCWSGVIWYVKGNGTKEMLLDTRAVKKNSADISYDAKTKTVFIPTFWGNTVAAYQVK